MKIEIDPDSGFCFGVVRAISLAEQNVPLVSLGDIVHNSGEVARLREMGLRTVDEGTPMESLAGQSVLIRAHGEPPQTYRQAERFGVRLIDATCPVVAALQRTVAQAFGEMQRVGGQVVIFGRRGHAEVVGLLGQIESQESRVKSQESRVKSQESRVKSQESRVKTRVKSQESRVKSQESRVKSQESRVKSWLRGIFSARPTPQRAGPNDLQSKSKNRRHRAHRRLLTHHS